MQVLEEKKLLSKEDYYKDNSLISYSTIKVFSRCETLYRDIFVTKTYAEPDHDYFLYGKLVDAFVTESPKFVQENFILVDKKVKPEDALKYECEIRDLQQELLNLEEKCLAGNKTALKGKESRLKKIDELEERLSIIRNIDGKEQVTNSIWQNAEETALAIKSHPYYSAMEFNEFTSQQIIIAKVNGIMRKGRLDHLKLCPQIEKLYKLYVANQISYDDMAMKITAMNQSELWAVITDIKTCYDIAKLEPYNNHYRGQLGFYQDLVSQFFLIPITQIKCQILAGDKLSSTFKKSELFSYSQGALDEIKPDIEAWVKLWKSVMERQVFISAKVKSGINQKCFTCTECRFAPFSVSPGQPVLIDKPRFSFNEAVTSNSEDSQEEFTHVDY